jgi:hypothetical protein
MNNNHLFTRLRPEAIDRFNQITDEDSKSLIEKKLARYEYFIDVPFGDASYICMMLRWSADMFPHLFTSK